MTVIRFCLAFILAVFICGCAEKPELIERKCSGCHKTKVVYEEKRSMEDWKRLIHGMKARGLQLTPDEEKAILEILEKRYSN